VARGAKAINFWCWRDEVFTREASGFGIAGNDGFAPERIQEMAKTGALFERHAELVDAYEPDHGRVGVVFDPTSYYLDYSQYGDGHELAVGSLAGYLQTLERLQVPYEIVETKRRSRLAGCRVLVLSWPLHVDPDLAADVLAWVRAGGTLLVESELDAYDALGFYRYPGERPFADALGVRSLGRRTATGDAVPWALGGAAGELTPHSWLEPYATDGVEVLGEGPVGALVVRREVGAGQVIAVGTFAGLAAADSPSPALERFVAQVVAAGGGAPDLACGDGDGDSVQWRLGRANGHRVLIVTNGGPARTLRFSGAALDGAGELEELTAGTSVPVREAVASVQVPGDGYAVLRWAA
jgi:beta-galactosidase